MHRISILNDSICKQPIHKRSIRPIRRWRGLRGFLNSTSGFTLIELMIVLVILGTLVAIIAPRLMGNTDEAMVTQARVQISNFETALKMYKLHNGFYPTSSQGLSALVTRPASSPEPRKWQKGGYIEKSKIPSDPWKNKYVYASPGIKGDYDILSYGADGIRGGDEFDTDISNWDVE